MKKIDLGQTIGVLANIGVIAGIVFLAMELRQNNDFLKSDAEYRVMQNRMLFATELLGDNDLLTAYQKVQDGQSLDRLERDRLNFLYSRLYFSVAWEWAQAERGLTQPFPVGRMRQFLNQNEVARERWREIQHDFEELDPDFYQFLVENQLLLE